MFLFGHTRSSLVVYSTDGQDGFIIIIAFCSALYFSDTRMKTVDNSFAGSQAVGTSLVLVLLATKPNWQVILIIVLLSISMFTNLKFIHPIRTVRWRKISLPISILWTFFLGLSAWHDFDTNLIVKSIARFIKPIPAACGYNTANYTRKK